MVPTAEKGAITLETQVYTVTIGTIWADKCGVYVVSVSILARSELLVCCYSITDTCSRRLGNLAFSSRVFFATL